MESQINENEADNLALLDDFVNLRDEGRNLYNSVFRYVKRELDNYDAAEDVMIEVQLKAWSKRDTYDSSRRLMSWLFSIAHNSCRDYQRKNKRWNRRVRLEDDLGVSEEEGKAYVLAGDYVSPLDKMEEDENRARLKTAVERLPDRLRSVVTLVGYYGLEQKDVAEILGIPRGTLKSRLNKAKMDLREQLDPAA